MKVFARMVLAMSNEEDTMLRTMATRRDALRLASEANVDPRTAAKAIAHGASAIRKPVSTRAAIVVAAAKLGMQLPEEEG